MLVIMRAHLYVYLDVVLQESYSVDKLKSILSIDNMVCSPDFIYFDLSF